MPRILKRKKDYAESKTDEMLSDLEKRIEREYRTAYNEVSEKYLNFIKGSAVREEEKLRQLQEGKITEADFKKWKEGQVFIGKRWSDMADELAQDLTKVDKKALSMTNGFLPDAYALNHNYATYEVEKRFGINSSYTLYSRETVERLLRDDPNMLPKRKVDVAKDKRWNKQHINSAITQGVLQGDDLRSISKRLRSVTDMDKTAAIRNARTMMTGAQNSGRIDAMKRMRGIGVNVKKEWIATLDHHTRASHGRLDGEIVDIDKKFSNGCMYPGDPNGLPAEVYNCRCTVGYNFPEYPDEDVPRYDNENQKRIKGMTYTQWAKTKLVDTVPAVHKIVDGKDSSGTWKRRPEQFDFEIEDVMNAQGFDGLPRVVSPEEFDKLVKQANDGSGFIAQRTYSAPDQETLDAYRDQLYKGKWYVDCSTGGAQYGQGMYCAADYTGTLTDGIKTEMSHYKDLGQSRNDSAAKELAFQKVWDNALRSATDEERALIKREYLINATDEEMRLARAFEKRDENAYDALVDKYASVAQKARAARDSAEAKSYTETLTLDPSAQVITYNELMDIRTGNLSLDYRTDAINDIIKKSNYTDDEATFMRFNLNTGVTWNEVSDAVGRLSNERVQELSKEFPKIGEEATKRYNEEHDRRIERAKMLQHKFNDPGSLAVALGYDAINAEGHGQSGSYTVILNRTKVIFKGE